MQGPSSAVSKRSRSEYPVVVWDASSWASTAPPGTS